MISWLLDILEVSYHVLEGSKKIFYDESLECQCYK